MFISHTVVFALFFKLRYKTPTHLFMKLRCLLFGHWRKYALFYTKTIAWICHILQQSIIFQFYYQPEWLHHIYVIHILICYQSPKCMTKTCLHHICWFAISGIPCLSGPLKMHTHTHTERSHIPLRWNNMIAKFHWFFGGNIWLNVPRYFARSRSPFWKI